MIEKILIISFIVIGVWCMYLPTMILGWAGDWLDSHLPEWLKPPIYDCCVCMAFWYGSVLYWIIWGQSVKEWLIVIFASMGFNTIFVKIKKH